MGFVVCADDGQDRLPAPVAKAASGLVASILAEVEDSLEERCKGFEVRLRGELEAQVADHCTSGLEALAGRLAGWRAEAQAEQEALADLLTARLDARLETSSIDASRRKCEHQAEDCPEQLLPHLGIEEYTSRQQDLCLSELRELCERGLASLSLRLDAAVEGIEHVDSASMADVEQICSSHEAAVREAIEDLREKESELRDQVAGLELSMPSMSVRQQQHGDMQKCKDQLLNLSMRVSELAMCSDRDCLQSLLDEQTQATRRLEELVESTAGSGSLALQKLHLAQSRGEQRLTALQRKVQTHLHELLEELSRQHILINVEHFKSIGSSSGPQSHVSGTSSPMPASQALVDDGCATM